MRDQLLNLFQKAISELNPYNIIDGAFKDGSIQINGTKLALESFPEIYILAMGKASVEMARAAMNCGGVKPEHTLVVCPMDSEIPEVLKGHCIQSDHPVPGTGSKQAGSEVIQFVKNIPEDALFLCCISGGTSSLAVQPAGDISLVDLNKTHVMLLNSGADIYEMNTVRKHLSDIKGGQLLRHLNEKVTLVNLIISDVPGDDPTIIGSGPTVPDSSTFIDASKVLSSFGLWNKVPESVRKHIKKGMSGNAPETVKAGEIGDVKHLTHIVASAGMLAQKVAGLAQSAGYRVQMASEAYNEEVGKVAAFIAERAKKVAGEMEKSQDPAPCLLVYYGESKVSVTGSGKGGRNQELALRGALKIEGHENITWLSIGTDGIDGPTDAAGAAVDGRTIEKAREKGLDPDDYLKRNDSYHFHEQMGTLVKTGPTGNNLMDLQMVLIN